jgi:tetratricopeptide (TPR) repeat protein
MSGADSKSTNKTFVGRERELAELVSACEAGTDNDAHLFLISGEPGIGKTRLADELASRVKAKGLQVLWGRCWEGDGAPAYWPWIQVIRSFLGALDPQRRSNLAVDTEIASDVIYQVSQIIPDLRPTHSLAAPATGEKLEPSEARFRLFDAVTNFLKMGARSHPMLIVLDDLHDADETSLALLRFMARELKSAAIMIVATYRDLEVRRSPSLSKMIGQLSREARPIPLSGLSESEVSQLVQSRAGRAPDQMLITKLCDATNGNPLFVDGIVRSLMAEGALGSAGAVDRTFKIPSGIREAIRLRLDHLSLEANSLLQVAAVIGNEFDFALCWNSAELPENGGRRLLEETTRAGIVTRLDRDRHRFSHALIRDAVYEELDPERRIRLHGKIASTLEETFKENIGAHLAELAYHFREAGLAEKAIDYSVRAGKASATVFAYNDAVTHLQVAVELMERQDPDALRRADLLFFVGSIAFWVDRETALKYWESAGALYEKLGRFDKAGMVYVQLGIIFHMRGEPQANASLATDYLRRAELAIPKEPETIDLASLYTIMAQNEAAKMNFAQAAIAARHSMQICERLAIERNWPRIAAVAEYAETLCIKGQLSEGFALLDQTFEMALQTKVSGYESAWRAGFISILLADPRGAQLWWERERTRLKKDSSPLAVHFFSAWIDIARFDEGHLVDMEKKYSSDPQAPTFGSARRSWLGGQWEDAAKVLAREVERCDRADNQLYSLSQSLFAGLTNLLVGEHARAEVLFRYGLDDTDKATKLLLEMRARPRLAQLYAETKRPSEAAEQVARCQRIMAGGEDWRGLAGGVARANGIIEAARGNFDIALQEFEGALAVHQKYHLAWEEADTLQSWGRALAAVGDKTSATQKFEAAIEIYRSRGAHQRFVDHVMTDKLHALGATSPPPQPASAKGTFRREGEFWTISYNATTFRLKDAKGLHYLAYLLARPGQRIHVYDLIEAVEGHAVNGRAAIQAESEDLAIVREIGGLTPTIDGRARSEYRTRLRDLQAELDEAERMNDLGRCERLSSEIEMVGDELTVSSGLGGRARMTSGSAERARGPVRKNIRSVVEKIRGEHPALGRHFATSISTGYFCIYQPDPDHPISWQL